AFGCGFPTNEWGRGSARRGRDAFRRGLDPASTGAGGVPGRGGGHGLLDARPVDERHVVVGRAPLDDVAELVARERRDAAVLAEGRDVEGRRLPRELLSLLSREE